MMQCEGCSLLSREDTVELKMSDETDSITYLKKRQMLKDERLILFKRKTLT